MTATTEPTAAVGTPLSRDGWLIPALVFLAVAAVLLVVVQLSHDHLPSDPTAQATTPQPGDPSRHDFIGGWMGYDSGWYLTIARSGYSGAEIDNFEQGRQSAVAFFPAYPVTVRQVARVTGDDEVVAAYLTTLLSGLAAALLFWNWCGTRMRRTPRTVALLLLLLYPYAWYLYGSGYGDAFFLAATLAAFTLLERDRPVLAGLFGAVASAARVVGIATVVGLIALALQRRDAIVRAPADGPRRFWSGWRIDWSRLHRKDAGVLLSAGGIAGYCAFLYAKTGDWHAFTTVQAAPGWNQGTGLRTLVKYNFLAEVFRGDPAYSIRLVLQAMLVVVFLAAIPFVFKRFGAAYGVYAAVMVGIPLVGDASFQGAGRYLIGSFPVFALAGVVLVERTSTIPRLRPLVLGTSALLLIALASFFGRGYYLA